MTIINKAPTLGALFVYLFNTSSTRSVSNGLHVLSLSVHHKQRDQKYKQLIQ